MNVVFPQERTGVKMIMIQDDPMPTGSDKPLRITGDPYKVQVCVCVCVILDAVSDALHMVCDSECVLYSKRGSWWWRSSGTRIREISGAAAVTSAPDWAAAST